MTIAEMRRQRFNVTQAEFARMIGVSIKSVQAYEQGRRQPSRKTVAKIAGAARMRPPEVMAMLDWGKEDGTDTVSQHP